MFARKRFFYWVVPAVLVGALVFQGCGDDDGDEFCSDTEIFASEELCEAFAEDNNCGSFDFTPPETCELNNCDCVIVDDDVFDD